MFLNDDRMNIAAVTIHATWEKAGLSYVTGALDISSELVWTPAVRLVRHLRRHTGHALLLDAVHHDHDGGGAVHERSVPGLRRAELQRGRRPAATCTCTEAARPTPPGTVPRHRVLHVRCDPRGRRRLRVWRRQRPA